MYASEDGQVGRTEMESRVIQVRVQGMKWVQVEMMRCDPSGVQEIGIQAVWLKDATGLGAVRSRL